MRLKKIKRASAVLISVLLVAVITVTTVLADSLLNGTEAENAATPKYYGAIKDWQSAANSQDTDTVFNYQFALDGSNLEWDYMSAVAWGYWYTGNTDYTNFSGITEDEWSEKYTNSSLYYSAAIGPKGYMRIWNRSDCLASIDTTPAAALTYFADEDGYVNILSHSASLFGTYFTKGQDYRVLLRITKNGENIYPESDYLVIDETETSVSFPELDIEVSKGDAIRFEMTSDIPVTKGDGDSISVSWNPGMYVRPEETLYTQTNDILSGLTSFMNSVFSGKYSETMDSTANDALTLARANSYESKYGAYTAMDSVYSDGVIPSDDNSVWKFAVMNSVVADFQTPTDDYSVKAEKTDKGTLLSWSADFADGLNPIRIIDSDGKGYTYIANSGINSMELPVTSDENGFTLQISSDNTASKPVRVYTDSEGNPACEIVKIGDITYLNSCTKSGSNTSLMYTLKDSSVNSCYNFKYSYNAVKTSSGIDSDRRTIQYNAVPGEQMMFGFTAVQSGNYEITAPISSESDTVIYSILKQSSNGTLTVIDGPNDYKLTKRGFAVHTGIKAGETVWLNAETKEDTVIDIGIPRVTLKEETTDKNGASAYKYRAVDYVESKYFNNAAYVSASLTENSQNAWSFGYFSNPIETVDSTVNYDTLGFGNYAIGDDASALLSAFSPYELIRSGGFYNSRLLVCDANGVFKATHEGGVPGTLRTITGTSYAERGLTGLPYQSKGITASVGTYTGKDGNLYNIGVYLRFTAAISGNAALNISDYASAHCTNGRIIIIKNGEVIKTYGAAIGQGTVINIGYMNKGDTVDICYGKTSAGSSYNYIGMPVMTVSGEKCSVSLDESLNNLAKSSEYTLTSGDRFILPLLSGKAGMACISWKTASGEEFASGESITITADTSLSAVLDYYGDLNSDSKINSEDLVLEKTLLLTDDSTNGTADVNDDGLTDLKDLVRMKKWLAGYTVTLGAQ